MSLTPDAILKTFLVVEKVEKNLKKWIRFFLNNHSREQ
jgi:hypothetical protein